jgi:hypothetical protein
MSLSVSPPRPRWRRRPRSRRPGAGWGLILLLASFVPLMGAAVPLAIVDILFQQSDGGEPLPIGFTYVAGSTVYFSFQIEGYKASPDEKVHLSYQVEALDPQGVRIMEPIQYVVEATLTLEDKHWKPTVHHEIAIPPVAASGTYKIVITVTDEVAHTTVTKEIPFGVRGHHVEPSATLVIRNFHFYRGEQDNEALQVAAYRPGDSIWARFDITGFKYGEGNAIDVSYDVAVSAPSGKVIYTQPEAAVEKTQSFYPKRYVPGAMSLETKADTRPGTYGVLITVHDGIGRQTYEAHQNFTIE